MEEKECNWCQHPWHEGECWCYCLEATTAPEPNFCDKCGVDLEELGEFVVFEQSPWTFTAFDGTPIDAGVDGTVLCINCHNSWENSN